MEQHVLETLKHIIKIHERRMPGFTLVEDDDALLIDAIKYALSEKPAPKNAEKLRENLENHMIMLQENSDRVAKYFNHPSIKYAA